MSTSRNIEIPADVEQWLRDQAAAMGVPPSWVLSACVMLAMEAEDANETALVLAVESARDGWQVPA